MKRIKTLVLFIMLFGLQGCITPNSYYVLSISPQPTTLYAKENRVIGVKKVTIPEYLYKREIAVARSSSQITLLSGAVWGEDLDAGLTQRLIGFLQKKFREPNVHAYPWGVDTQPNIIVSVDITRFIAYGDKVYLDANWEVKRVGTPKSTSDLFYSTVPTKSDAASIVEAMNRAFGELEEDVAKGIKGL